MKTNNWQKKPKKHALWQQAFPNQVKPNTTKNTRSLDKPRKRIHRRTSKRANEERIYNLRVRVWLRETGNTFCHCCVSRNSVIKPNPSMECHHLYGKRGDLLLWEDGWLPICKKCHFWVHFQEPEMARNLGMLPPKGCWNRFPVDSQPACV